MSNRRKVFQGLIILVVLFSVLGAIACIAPVSAKGVSHPASVVITSDLGNSSNIGLTADTGEVCRTSVAWNRWARNVRNVRDVRRSVAWN